MNSYTKQFENNFYVDVYRRLVRTLAAHKGITLQGTFFGFTFSIPSFSHHRELKGVVYKN